MFLEGRMTVPTAVFGFIVATLFGAGFHLAFGGDMRRLALLLLAGWLGFCFCRLDFCEYTGVIKCWQEIFSLRLFRLLNSA
jgi:hypothetical protein